MPIYEYLCSDCGADFSSIKLSAHSVEDTKCPKCKSSNVVKKVSSFSCTVASSASSGGYSSGGGGG